MAVADSLLADPAKARSVTEQPPRVAVTARRDSARPPQQQARPAQAEQRETLAPDISERPRARADASSPQLDPVPKIAAAQPDGGQARPPGLPQAAASGPARHAGTGPGKEATAYPDAVMRRLSKAARPRVGLRGEAVIAFEVAADGSLAHASVARSSGAPALDSAALAFVRGAAPFPPPPDGAQRSFSIRIAGR
jgi:protein TonB